MSEQDTFFCPYCGAAESDWSGERTDPEVADWETMDSLRARVAELEARVRPVNGYGIALMMIAEGVNDPRHFAKDTLAKWRPIINAGIST